MSNTIIQSTEVVDFARSSQDRPAELVLHGLAGVCGALDELATNISPQMDRRESERLAGLALAASILSQQLVHRMTNAPVTPARQAAALERLHSVG